jgi:chitodextrinase
MAMIAIAAASAALDAGLLIYRALTQKREPLPPLRDLQMMTATSGAPIPFGYGVCRVPGNVIWSTGIAYSNHGGKKSSSGPGVYFPEANAGVNYGPSGTYVFSTNLAVAFGEGPGQIQRIWGDSKLIYDSDPASSGNIPVTDYPAWSSTQVYQPGNQVSFDGQVWQALTINADSAPGTLNTNWLNVSPYPAWSAATEYFPGDIVTEGGNIWVAQTQMNNGIVDPQLPSATGRFTVSGPNGNYNAYYWIPLSTLYLAPTLYPGTNTQTQDPLIQGFEGSELTPAYRGLIYAVFQNFYLFNFADRIPSFRAQVNYTKVASIV